MQPHSQGQPADPAGAGPTRADKQAQIDGKALALALLEADEKPPTRKGLRGFLSSGRSDRKLDPTFLAGQDGVHLSGIAQQIFTRLIEAKKSPNARGAKGGAPSGSDPAVPADEAKTIVAAADWLKQARTPEQLKNLPLTQRLMSEADTVRAQTPGGQPQARPSTPPPAVTVNINISWDPQAAHTAHAPATAGPTPNAAVVATAPAPKPKLRARL